ncbi:DEAD/DEAH box helicase [Microbacterium testaceum]|uniref:DEAD/DEAH box helicase n=1 Tax=Microbacterium testaceum TaxID=2033 RepID=UPI000B1C1629|nr:DEAD/DEAH box helicase [Microbacterium testaceum]
MAFKPNPTKEPTAESPEQLLQLLPRTKGAVTSLWSHQADVLRDYHARYQESRDVAIELPTGTGKTLPGLLIADWRRRKNGGRVVYACPTVQLVRQVVRTATKQTIPVVDLSGKSSAWRAADKVAFEGGRAIAVATYSAIFNVNPKLTDLDLIVFDDAHAGEQYVAAAYSVQVSRRKHAAVYEDLVEAVRPSLSKERHNELIMTTPPRSGRRSIDAVFPALIDTKIPSIDAALQRLSTVDDRAWREQAFNYSSIRGHLTACTIYLTWDEISIRPLIPPTFENAPFSSAGQRLYLSATLGASGELERAFGRPKIRRLALPDSAGRPTSGRRFVVFPHLVRGTDPHVLTRNAVQMARKAIVISPSNYLLSAADPLVPEGWERFVRDDIVESFDEFASADDAVCLLANRYDGIDLPGDACHCVVLFGHPNATHLQERFLAERARASAAIEERVRSRVVQGTGRCTRHADDWALVIIADADMTGYLARGSVQATLDEDLQAEVRFGLDQSLTTEDDFLENVETFLEQGEAWAEVETAIAEYRAKASRVSPKDWDTLAESAENEVKAIESAWTQDYRAAGEALFSAAESLATSQSARGHRAMLMFLAAVYTNFAGRELDDEALLKAASSLADKSVLAATPATWMRSLMPLPQEPERGRTGADLVAVQRLSDLVAATTNTAKHDASIVEMHAGLASTSHKTFEPALSTLGELLGAEAWKPDGDARADSVWCWADERWITLEAKSEHQAGGQIGIEDVRNNNHHVELLAKDRGVVAPQDSVSVMISPLTVVKADAQVIAAQHTYLVTPDVLVALGADAERLWKRILTLRNVTDREARESGIADALRDFRLYPSDVADLLTVRPLSE